MPDATGLELIAQELREAQGARRRCTGHAVLPRPRDAGRRSPTQIRSVLAHLREQGYSFMASLHGVDHYPEEPRLGVVYELLDMSRVDRITVKLRVPSTHPRSTR